MEVDIKVNIFDVILLIRRHFEQKLGEEIGEIQIKSWQKTVLTCDDRGMCVFCDGTRHALRIEHSDIINPNGSIK